MVKSRWTWTTVSVGLSYSGYAWLKRHVGNPNSPMKFFARSRLSVALQGPNRVEDFDHHPQQNGSPDWPSPAQTSFVQIDQEDEEDYNYDQDMPVQASNRKDKGKERAKPPDEENEEELVHEEILQSLNDIQPNASDNDEEDLPPPSKKPRTETQPPKRPRSRPKKINVPIQEGLYHTLPMKQPI
jgi:hypothetical protein